MIDQSQLLRLLGLTEIAIDRVDITDADVLEIHVHSSRDGAQCRRCGRRITESHGHGQERRLRHLPIFGHRTELVIRPKRYHCPDCHDHPTTTQRLDWYDPRSAFTRAFEQSLLRALINSTSKTSLTRTPSPRSNSKASSIATSRARSIGRRSRRYPCSGSTRSP
jgi:transposase